MNPNYVPISLRKMEAKYGIIITEDAQPFASALLKKKYDDENNASYLMEEACKMAVPDFEEKNVLDRNEYGLNRAFVEVMELRREKSVSCQRDVLPRAKEELVEFRSKWHCFRSKWFSVLEQQTQKARRRPELLKPLNEQLLRLMATIKKSKLDEDFSKLPPLLYSFVDDLEHTVHSAFMEMFTVGPRQLVKASSKLCGRPEECCYLDLRRALQINDIKSKLSKKLIGLDGVIHKIGCSLSELKSDDGPLGSFLLLGRYGCGRKSLAKALAEEIYGDKERFIVLNMSLFRHEPDLVWRIIKYLRVKKNGSVVMFENIDDDRIFQSEILQPIITSGLLSDYKGSVSFPDDIVLVSSHVGHALFCGCECLQYTIPNLPFREILKDPALLHNGISSGSGCSMEQFCYEVNEMFDTEFLQLFNDLLVFPYFSLQDHIGICRHQFREVAERMCDKYKKQVIIYPSDAALNYMLGPENILDFLGANVYKEWYRLHQPRELDGRITSVEGDVVIIFIDLLLYSRNAKFHFRVENGRHLQKFPSHWRFKESISNLWSIYRKKKKQESCDILKLKAICSSICDLIREKPEDFTGLAYSKSNEAVELIKKLLIKDANEVVQLDYFVSDEELSGKLQRLLEQQPRETRDIVAALLRSLQTSEDEQLKGPAASFLCIGLTPKNETRLAECLQNLVMDDGKPLLVHVDLSQCREADSFFQYRTNTDLRLIEVVKRIPSSVVVFRAVNKPSRSRTIRSSARKKLVQVRLEKLVK